MTLSQILKLTNILLPLLLPKYYCQKYEKLS